jgi:hypothetical protein
MVFYFLFKPRCKIEVLRVEVPGSFFSRKVAKPCSVQGGVKANTARTFTKYRIHPIQREEHLVYSMVGCWNETLRIIDAARRGDTVCPRGTGFKEINMEPSANGENEVVIINEIQILLEEKRTSLAVMRTGIGVLVAQVLVSGYLIATSKSYQFMELLHMAVPFYIINAFLVALGGYLIISSLIHISRYDRVIIALKKRYRKISDLMD